MHAVRTFKCFLSCLFITCAPSLLQAQNGVPVTDTLARLTATAISGEKAKLFVHFDKTIYLPNETIWFTAYLLNKAILADQPDVLAVTMIKNSDRSIIIRKKLAVTGETAPGSILIPDSIAAGDYTIIAYTDNLVKGRPAALFAQQITVKRLSPSGSPSIAKPPVTAGSSREEAKTSLRFYPEGGSLVANLPAYVGWEAKNPSGAPLKLKAVLLKDGEFIDTIETSASGMGKFFINPKACSRYAVRVTAGSIQNTTNLPAIAAKGVALTLPAAWVQDTLAFKAASSLPGKFYIVIHNSRQVFYALKSVEIKTGRIFKIALDSLPRGLAAVTIYNENAQPCAERLFFAHGNSPPAVSLNTDAQKYGKRQKITLKLTLHSNAAAQALLSVACVRQNRINRRNFNDIANYGYLNQDLDFPPEALAGNENSLNRKAYREDVLLIRGWSRYTDTSTLASGKPDSIPRLTGRVSIGEKAAKKPLTLTLMGNSKVSFVNIDSSGEFSVDYADLAVPDGKTFALFATGDNAFTARIRVNDPFIPVNQWLAAKIALVKQEVSPNEKSAEPELFITQNQFLLKEVKIKANKDDQFYNTAATPGLHTNACGDYVCITNALNCPFPGHTYRTSVPIKGHRYMRHIVSGGEIIHNEFFIYDGCDTKNQSLIRFDGVNLNKEFYAYNNADVNAADSLYNSTLLWKNQVSLQKGKPAELSFYTGDISGTFAIIIQGITDSGVFYNEGQFEVTK